VTVLRKLAAALVLVGLCLPYACDVRPITGAWESPADAVTLGIPVLAALLYVLQEFLPPLAAAIDRHGRVVHGALRAVFLLLAGAYLLSAIQEKAGADDRLGVAGALLLTGAVLVWQQGRGTKAQRVPLLLLAVLGMPVAHVLVIVGAELQFGGWMVTAGWVLAVIEEVRLLRATPPVVHSG
jgi:hypothetical protein